MKSQDIRSCNGAGHQDRIFGNQRAASIFCVFPMILVLMLSFLFPVPVHAEEAKTVRVGYYENEVFQEGAREDAVKTGYAYEYYRKLSEYTGWQYEYVYGSYSDLYQKLLNHEIDLLAGLAYKPEREGLIAYPDEPMGHESYNLLKHAVNEEITSDPVSLSGRRIVVLESAMVDVLRKYLEEHHVQAEIVPLPDYEAVFEAFDTQKVDVIAVEGNGTYGRSDAEILCTFGASDYYLCVDSGREDLLSELNTAQALLSAEEPNYLNSLNEKYYPHTLFSRAFSPMEKEWMNTHNELKVGYLMNYLPYSDTDPSGEVTGLVKDVIPQIFETFDIAGMSYHYQGYESYDAMIADVNSGVVDVVFPIGGGLYFSEENGIYQSNPIISTSNELIYSGKYTEDTVSHIAVNRNNRIHEYYVRTYYPDAEITRYPSVEACLDAVLSGKAGSTFLNGLRANDILKNRKFRDLSLMHLSWSDDRCFGVKIGNDGLLKLLNRGINVIGSDYAQNRVYRYTDQLHSYTFLDYVMDHIAVFGSLILLAALLIILFLVQDTRRTRGLVHEKESAQRVLQEKNEELESSRKALSEALRAAEGANRAKTEFLNNMSHDMRTPMNAIVGFTALAESNTENTEQVRDYLGKISVSSRHLLALINDVLDMSRIESGKLTLEESGVHLPDVIRDLCTIVQANAAEKQQEFSVEVQPLVHEDVMADQLRLNRILLNILSNAVKFTPLQGKIRFMVRELPSEREDCANYEFRISDNGIGMSREFRKTIFEAFTRERSSTVSGIQGTGLGMAITKNIVDMMGGTISVDSEEGKGSDFTVCLPFRISQPETASGTPDHLMEKETEAADFSGKKVLLAEDNEMNQLIAVAILEKVGFTVEIAADGVQAVEKMKNAESGYYDIVLMDIQMPRMDGYEAARCIRALENPEKARIPIVAVTANAFEEDRKIALEAGMNAHLAKPYDVPEMMETISELLKKS